MQIKLIAILACLSAVALAGATTNNKGGWGAWIKSDNTTHKDFTGPMTRPEPRPWEIIPYNTTEADEHYNMHSAEFEKRGLDKRLVGGVYICAKHNWGGPCYWHAATGGLCHNVNVDLTSGSFGPDQLVRCRVFVQSDCYAAGNDFFWPGIWTLPNWWIDGGLKSHAVSYKCHWNWVNTDD